MAHSDSREGKWRGNWRMEWVASTLHTASQHGVSSITNADVHTSAASSPLNWRPRRFKWTRPFRRKTKSGFCACATTFQTQSRDLCVGVISVTEESYRVWCDWVWSWSLDTEEALAHSGLSSHEDKNWFHLFVVLCTSMCATNSICFIQNSVQLS